LKVPLRLFVVTGTSEFQFDRLVRGAARIAREAGSECECIVQYGSSAPPELAAGRAFDFCDGGAYRRHIADADVVIGHAGLGLVLDVLNTGTPTVLMPRLARFGEHVDDHQLQIAREIDHAGFFICADEELGLEWSDVRQLASQRRPPMQLGSTRLTRTIVTALGLDHPQSTS
jgi:UDP-N-acetylglucosamine transferase subunit ALG13